MSWVSKYNKQYVDEDTFLKRLDIFAKNFEMVSKLMEEEHLGQSFLGDNLLEMHELEMNQFADWTDEEYQQLLSFKPDLSKKPQNSSSETA